MAKLALNKSSLNRERKQLETYRRFLPSLELKQKQLLAARREALDHARRRREKLDRERADLGQRFPMLASEQFDLSGMVRIRGVRFGEENAFGVKLPTIEEIQFRIEDYSLLAEPHWVDMALRAVRDVIRLRLETEIAERRSDLLADAARKVTQRVNLFKEVLIPRAEENIRRIAIFLGDAERSAVIRAKIAKSRHQGAA